MKVRYASSSPPSHLDSSPTTRSSARVASSEERRTKEMAPQKNKTQPTVAMETGRFTAPAKDGGQTQRLINDRLSPEPEAIKHRRTYQRRSRRSRRASHHVVNRTLKRSGKRSHGGPVRVSEDGGCSWVTWQRHAEPTEIRQIRRFWEV